MRERAEVREETKESGGEGGEEQSMESRGLTNKQRKRREQHLQNLFAKSLCPSLCCLSLVEKYSDCLSQKLPNFGPWRDLA